MSIDSRLRVTRWLKPTQIQVWYFKIEIPVGTYPGHPRVHSCSALPQDANAQTLANETNPHDRGRALRRLLQQFQWQGWIWHLEHFHESNCMDRLEHPPHPILCLC
jgi:hypothetical protein